MLATVIFDQTPVQKVNINDHPLPSRQKFQDVRQQTASTSVTLYIYIWFE